MEQAAAQKFCGDPGLINPEIEGLDGSFDRVIREIPQSLIRAADDWALDPALSADPYTPLKDVRDRCGYVVRGQNSVFGGVPLSNNFGIDLAGTPHFIVLGIEEQDAIVKDTGRFRNEDAYGALGTAQGVAHGETVGSIPTVNDGEPHDFLRDFYDTFLNVNTMAVRSRRLIGPICEWLIERMVARLKRGDAACLVRDLALPLTYKAMSTMLGVPQDQLPTFVALGEKLFSAGVNLEEGAKAGDELFDFFFSEVEKRKRQPGKDALTYFVTAKKDDERVLNDAEAAITARFILPAGIETTWRGLALMLLQILAHRDQYDDVCQNPNLARRAVEEGLRYAPSGFVTPRLASEDMVVGDCEIPRGGHLTILQGITNRDPRRWENPDVFDIHRKFKSNRTFNTGVHSCAGQHLARLEMMTCLQLFAEHLPNLHLAIDPERVEIRGFQVRTPLHIPVRLK